MQEFNIRSILLTRLSHVHVDCLCVAIQTVANNCKLLMYQHNSASYTDVFAGRNTSQLEQDLQPMLPFIFVY